MKACFFTCRGAVKAGLDFGLWILDERRATYAFLLPPQSKQKNVHCGGSGGRRHGGIDEMLMHCEPCRPYAYIGRVPSLHIAWLGGKRRSVTGRARRGLVPGRPIGGCTIPPCRWPPAPQPTYRTRRHGKRKRYLYHLPTRIWYSASEHSRRLHKPNQGTRF